MTKAQLEVRLETKPFKPFRINTADGKSYDVVNPRRVVPMDTRVFIALSDVRWTLIVLGQVTSLGDVAEASGAEEPA